jgi:hypothetical protein
VNPNDALLNLIARQEANLVNAEQALVQQAEQLKVFQAQVAELQVQLKQAKSELV